MISLTNMELLDEGNAVWNNSNTLQVQEDEVGNKRRQEEVCKHNQMEIELKPPPKKKN